MRALRRRLGRQVHFWPFDGWIIAVARSAVVEVYPSLWRHSTAREGRSADQHDVYAAVDWMRRADLDGSLSETLDPPSTSEERRVALIEGWILGIK